MYKRIIILFVLFFYSSVSFPQENKTEKIFAPSTLKEERENFKSSMRDDILSLLNYELNNENEKFWSSAFWKMELGLVKDDSILSSLKKEIRNYYKFSNSFLRDFLEVLYTVYPQEFEGEVSEIMHYTSNPKIFAMCVNYLINAWELELHCPYYLKLMKTKFSDWKNNPILTCLNFELENHNKPKIITPPLVDILAKTFGENSIVIYSLQRKNRDYPGICIIKGSDNNFIRNSDNSIFHIPQLARSITNLPGYLTDGNTPQGIFSIQGTDFSQNKFIGPTENIQLILPFESSAKNFFHNDISEENFTKDLYTNLLPDSWKNYFPVYEAYYAGLAGRNEIIAHGTTIDPSLYEGKIYYPNTPSLGCLCAYENWSELTGERLFSYQQQLIDAFKSTGGNKGFLIVIEIDNQKSPVKIEEIEKFIFEAEIKSE